METTKNPNEYIFGLDIGTRTIIGTVGYKDKANRFQIVSQVVKEHETRAMIDGQIHDIEAVSKTISEVKHQLEQNIGIELRDVCIAAAGRVLKTVEVHVENTFENDAIITRDKVYALDLLGVEKAYHIINNPESLLRYYCVGYTIIKYYLNGYFMTSLEGHKGNIIEADILATFLPGEVVEGLYQSVQNAGLEVINLTLEPIAAMEVAIPENIRLLNLALVDVGAGTSDISITKDGSVVSFGMIPYAGDEITEQIAKKYLVDFKTAEKLKLSCLKKKNISYKDILGFTHKISTEEVINDLEEIVHKITKTIADKIVELNGGKSVSAVFVVGGGGKLPTFVEHLANELSLPKERVALRGQEVLGGVDFLERSHKKDSILVTPIGICLNYYDKRNTFAYVTLNGQVYKLYEHNHLTVMDAAMAAGLSTNDLFAKRGESLEFTINQEAKIIRGDYGEPARIYVNKREADLNTQITSRDIIEIKASVRGKVPTVILSSLEEANKMVTIKVNEFDIELPLKIFVNKQKVEADYVIQMGDVIQTKETYSVKEVLRFMDIPMESATCITIGEKEVCLEDEVREGDVMYVIFGTEGVEVSSSPPKDAREITISVNQTLVPLKHKDVYKVVDILDVFPFDLENGKARNLGIYVNHKSATFTTTVRDKDEVQFKWED